MQVIVACLLLMLFTNIFDVMLWRRISVFFVLFLFSFSLCSLSQGIKEYILSQQQKINKITRKGQIMISCLFEFLT